MEEMKGIAIGSGFQFLDILALNIRSEISMGLMSKSESEIESDGCTALYASSAAVLAQNWDWEEPQRDNLVVIHAFQDIGTSNDIDTGSRNDDDDDTISFSDSDEYEKIMSYNWTTVTEAGMVAKIGLNSFGVGVCLNAIRARGVDFGRLPVHIALRLVLDCSSCEEAVSRLRQIGVAAACHILVADDTGAAYGVECSFADIKTLSVHDNRLTHTNHWLLGHSGPAGRIHEAVVLPDSKIRQERVNYLLQRGIGKDAVHDIEKILEDQDNYPTSINREASDKNPSETLCSIVMDLKQRMARVRMGRPTEPVDSFVLSCL